MLPELNMRRRELLGLSLTSAAALVLGAPARADDLARLSIIISTAPGSTTDAVARAFAAAARQQNPALTVDVQNRDGGSGRLALKACLEAKGQANGLCFLVGSLIYALLNDGGDLRQQLSSVNLIGSLGADRRALFVSTKLGIKSFADVLAHGEPLVVPTVTAGASSHIEALMVNALTGARLKPVAGYSSPERKLALLSGEATAVVGSVDTFADLVEQGVLQAVLRLNDGGPDAPYGELPLLADVAKGNDAPLLTRLIADVAAANILIVAPPGLSGAEVDLLAALFDRTTAAMQAVVTPGLVKAEIRPASRATLMQHAGVLLAADPALAAAFTRATACGQDLADGKSCAAG